MAATTYANVAEAFHSMPMSPSPFPETLEYQWFKTALSEYELEIGALDYDIVTREFAGALPSYIVRTLALIMYCECLRRELSKAMKLNGFVTRDLTIKGEDATKRVTKAELDSELALAQALLHKLKRHSYD